ncbi:7TM diverse intracellular signalling [Flagellimonas taeanensis]|uniref:7TM diverse intracellular signalling n=2 Tax=Flagellimonas taeanensis TaxID=1005926 RepID=A0A1M6YFV7_9FLAO|nr:7TM diverse intracellular signalling [Allomuricauda taeanensis]SHL17108.1 7TM diverse intracellular signalling [Allomuricauda taeanensis]
MVVGAIISFFKSILCSPSTGLGEKCISDNPAWKQKAIRFLSLLTCCLMYSLGTTSLFAQTVEMDRKTKNVPFSILKVNDLDLGIDELLSSDSLFIADESWRFNDVNATYWVKLDFIDELDTLGTQESWRLRTLNYSKASMYYQKDGHIEHRAFGHFNKIEKNKSLVHLQGVSFKKQYLIDQRYLYLKVEVVEPYSRAPRFEYLSEKANRFYTDYYTDNDLNKVIMDHVYLGACLIFFLTFLIIFSYTKKAEFLCYALYIFFSAFFLVRFFFPEYQSFIGSLFGYWSVVVSQILINFFYVLFAMYYLNTKKTYPKLHMAMQAIVVLLLLLILLYTYSFYSGEYTISNVTLNLQRLLMTLFGIFSMSYLLFKAKDRLAIFIVTGSFIYMTGALLYMFTVRKYYMIIGSTLEIIIFSLALAYKIKQEYEAKLILQQEVSMKETNTLRAQMNPHFIFNSLNSIQHLILKDDKLSALKYLSKFGKIVRNVLESSHEVLVTLTEEIELLRSYLELESLRFDNSFEYTIHIDEELDTDQVEIPLMLIQPLVENAIIHGLAGKKEGNRTLSLRFEKKDDFCVIEIEDNGIGRHATGATKTHGKSRGMQITEKRLNMLHMPNGKKNTMEIIDKYDSESHPSGTKIIIRIVSNP